MSNSIFETEMKNSDKRMKLAIVGIWFDGYYDLWEDFLELFRKYWPECPYPLYVVEQEKEIDFDKDYNVTVLHAGADAEYSRKVQVAVNEIDADYYLLLLEDFFIGEPLKKNALAGVMKGIEEKGIKYYRIPLGEFTPKKYKGKIVRLTPDYEYTVSCQPSIWRRDFLKQCIGTDNYNAWVFEGIYSKSKKAHSDEFLDGCIIDYTNRLHLYHGALQGKMLNKTCDHFERMGYEFHNKRERLDKAAENKHKRKELVKSLIPINVQRYIKKHLKTSSVVERYDDQIQELITKMNL